MLHRFFTENSLLISLNICRVLLVLLVPLVSLVLVDLLDLLALSELLDLRVSTYVCLGLQHL